MSHFELCTPQPLGEFGVTGLGVHAVVAMSCRLPV
jgi:hypothetical protein